MFARLRGGVTYANVMATAAVFIALGGGAYAAVSSIPGRDGVIHACFGRHNGALRVVPGGARCGRNERALAFNQQGPRGPQGLPGAPGQNGAAGAPGTPGTPGATNLQVRKTTADIPVTCTPSITPGFWSCIGSGTVTAQCQSGEHATGGSYSAPAGSFLTITSAGPNPDSGAPTGWSATGSVNNTFSPVPVSTASVTVEAICASG